jgi:crotonobetainyl-CoA:carnitine CoA-transferase CaiB-like acyl-CoA transferase
MANGAAHEQDGKRPLEGVRIIDATHIMMGPAATQILADYGADVVKVEPPNGDIMRHAGSMKHEGMGPIYLHANRNKRSIVIDLKKRAGRNALLRMTRTADMFIHNVRPAAMRRLGLDYPDLAAINPRIIYVALVGFDQRGPYAHLPAVDDVIQGAAGMASLLAEYSGGSPSYVPMAIADRVCGINAAQVALAALFMRERTGKGQSIEVPMFETVAQLVMADHLGGETFDPPAGPMGYRRLLTPHRRPFKTRDGYLALLVYTDGQWQQFFDAIGQPDTFRTDARFTTAAARAKHHDAAYAMISEILVERTTAEWVELLRDRDIPCMPLHDPRSLMKDPHLEAIGFFQMIDHPTEGRLRAMRVASRWSDANLSIRRHAPNAGEHSIEILQESGFTGEEIEELLADGAVVSAVAQSNA